MTCKKLAIAILVCACLAAYGCADILEGDVLIESHHSVQPFERPPEEQIEIRDFDELKIQLMRLILEHADAGRLYAYNYDGDIQADVDLACLGITETEPVGVYAVSDIQGVATRILSYYEVDITIEYKRTKSQVDSLITVSTLRYLRTELLSHMSEYGDMVLFRTNLRDITEEDMAAYAKEVYYDNPRRIVMMPVMVVDTFPRGGDDRIFELGFSNVEQAGILRQYGSTLSVFVRRNALAAGGDNDAEILLSLTQNLMAACVYDEGTARAISEHGAQNFAATAYGALVNGSAVGEGFAMAFKALCDELEFECIVVLGYREGMLHAWNIVSVYGDYYHIDVSMCVVNGIETAFLKTDPDFEELYIWDMRNTVKCEGTLTYEEVAGVEPPINGDGGDVDGAGENPDGGVGDVVGGGDPRDGDGNGDGDGSGDGDGGGDG